MILGLVTELFTQKSQQKEAPVISFWLLVMSILFAFPELCHKFPIQTVTVSEVILA